MTNWTPMDRFVLLLLIICGLAGVYLVGAVLYVVVYNIYVHKLLAKKVKE